MVARQFLELFDMVRVHIGEHGVAMSCIKRKSHVLAQVIVNVDNACAFIVYTYQIYSLCKYIAFNSYF